MTIRKNCMGHTILIAVSIIVFFAGFGVASVVYYNPSNPPLLGHGMTGLITSPETMNQMMNDPQQMNQWMNTMMNDSQMQQQMIDMMMNNQDMMNSMMNNQQMMNMMGIDSMMMNQDMMGSQSSQIIPLEQEPQTRTFQVSMEEVEFFAEIENEDGTGDVVLVEKHTWEPNLIIVNQGDTVVLEIFNPRKHAHIFSIPDFGITSQILEPREGMDTVTFVADTSGVFTFSCGLPYNPDQLYCAPDHSMMTGTLIVLGTS